MNVFENSFMNFENFFEGKTMLEKARLPIESRYDFAHEEKWALNNAFKGEKTCLTASFVTPMWFIRAMRKHSNVYYYSSHGHDEKSWVWRENADVEKHPWEYGGRAFSATLALKTKSGLVFFTSPLPTEA